MEPRRSGRVRLLLERESERRPPTLVAGLGTPDRRARAKGNPNVQRIRGGRSRTLRGDGPEEVLLNHDRYSVQQGPAFFERAVAARAPFVRFRTRSAWSEPDRVFPPCDGGSRADGPACHASCLPASPAYRTQ